MVSNDIRWMGGGEESDGMGGWVGGRVSPSLSFYLSVAEFRVLALQQKLLRWRPGVLTNRGVKLVVPTFTALLAAPATQTRANSTPPVLFE